MSAYSTTPCWQLDVPAHFWDDHADRCGFEGRELQRLRQGSMVRLDISGDSIADLYSDADYYSSFTGDDYVDNRGIVQSARATLRHLRKRFSDRDLQAFTEMWRERQRAEQAAY
jgi:hypothetical protein